jgi:uncharacterized RDD family membrane protein YckC
MRIAKRLLALILVLAGLSLVSPSLAEDVYVLADGSKAIIVERQLIVYPSTGSNRYFARPGRYQTRDKRYTIVVTPKGATVIMNGPPRDN